MRNYILLYLLFTSLLMIAKPISVTAYTSCDGIEYGDQALLTWEGRVKRTGDNISSGEKMIFEISADSLIQRFYEGVLGIKIGERKIFEVPPDRDYTNPDTAPDGLYGETLIFDVYVEDLHSDINSCDEGNEDNSQPINITEPGIDFDLDLQIPTLTTFVFIVMAYLFVNRSRKRI